MSDAIVVFRDKEIKVHSMVLAKKSPWFKRQFEKASKVSAGTKLAFKQSSLTHWSQEERTNTITIETEPCDMDRYGAHSALYTVLEYCYTGGYVVGPDDGIEDHSSANYFATVSMHSTPGFSQRPAFY